MCRKENVDNHKKKQICNYGWKIVSHFFQKFWGKPTKILKGIERTHHLTGEIDHNDRYQDTF